MSELSAISGQRFKINGVSVVVVASAPAIAKVEMMGGIRDKEAAAAWAQKNGYETVYLLQPRQRVYADKLTKRVDVLAKQLQSKSDHLVQMAEA